MLALPAIAALVTFAVLMPALDGELVWDDRYFLLDSPVYRNAASAVEAAFAPFVLSPNYFRPLGVLSFVWELRLFGSDAWFMHLTNLLLHCLSTFLLTLLMLRTDRGSCPIAHGYALIAALLFGLHPVMSEGVGFVSCRFDLLLTLSSLLLLHASELRPASRARTPLMIVCMLLACLSKESAAALIVALPIVAIGSPGRAAPFRTACGLLCAALAYLLLRWIGLGRLFVPAPEAAVLTGGVLSHLLLVGRSFLEYLLLIISPFGRVMPVHWAELPISGGDVLGWIGLGLLALEAALLARALPRSRSARLLAAALVTLLPVLNIAPLELSGGAFVADRFVMLPMVFVSLAVFEALRGLRPASAPALAIMLGLALWTAAGAIEARSALASWRDDCALWRAAEARAPKSTTVLNNLALCRLNGGDIAGGEALSRRSLAILPGQAEAWNNLGLALARTNRIAESISAFEQAVALQPAGALYRTNLGAALRVAGRPDDSRRVLEEAVERDASFGPARVNLALLDAAALDWAGAIARLEASLPLMRQDHLPEIRNLLAQLKRSLVVSRSLAQDPRYADAGIDQARIQRLMLDNPNGWKEELDRVMALGRRGDPEQRESGRE